MTSSRLNKLRYGLERIWELINYFLDRLNQRINKKIVFCQIPVGSLLHKFGQEGIITLSGENNNRHIFVHFPDFPQGIQAIQGAVACSGKDMIKDNEPGTPMQVFKAFFPGLKSNYMIILPALKCVFQQVQNHLVIVNEEDQFTHRGIESPL